MTGDGLPDLYFVDYNNTLEDRLWIDHWPSASRTRAMQRMTLEMRESDFGVHAVIVDVNGDGAADVSRIAGSTAIDAAAAHQHQLQRPGRRRDYFNAFEVVYNGNPYHVDIGHLNDDGLSDLVIEDDGTDRYLLNQGNGPDGLADFRLRLLHRDRQLRRQHRRRGRQQRRPERRAGRRRGRRLLRLYRYDAGLAQPREVARTSTFDAQSGGIPVAARTGTYDVAVFDINGDGWRDLVLGTCTGTSVWIAEPVHDLLEQLSRRLARVRSRPASPPCSTCG